MTEQVLSSSTRVSQHEHKNAILKNMIQHKMFLTKLKELSSASDTLSMNKMYR